MQFKNINSSVLSLLYGPTLTSVHDTGKAIVLAIWTFVSKVISLLFNMLSRFVITFPWVGKLSSGLRTRKDQFSFQSQGKTMLKNVDITIQLHSFHALARLC